VGVTQLAFIAILLELVVNAPIVLLALCAACVPHALRIARSATLTATQGNSCHVPVFVEQERLELPHVLLACLPSARRGFHINAAP
jgi:hypothetical protein